jgi:gas vesicle protein
MNNEVNKSGGNFLSGFLIGALVGAAVVFFLGTKKGKRILKIISEKGLDNVSNILDKVEKTADLEEVFEEEPSLTEVPVVAETVVNKPEEQKRKSARKVRPTIEDKAKTKRFFRGISRHVN